MIPMRRTVTEGPLKKILIVDDEQLMRYSLTAIFKDRDCDVMTAATGQDALQAISRTRFDLCFLDIHLPDVNGLDIMRDLRACSPGTRIVMMTGGEVTGSMLDSIRSYADLFLSKPFDLFQIKTLVAPMLSNGRPIYSEPGASGDLNSGILWVADDARKHPRRPANKPLAYLTTPSSPAMSAEVRLARIFDISESGLGLVTECSHEPGTVLKFMHDAAWRTGIVRWTMSTGVDNQYRTGVLLAAAESTIMQA